MALLLENLWLPGTWSDTISPKLMLSNPEIDKFTDLYDPALFNPGNSELDRDTFSYLTNGKGQYKSSEFISTGWEVASCTAVFSVAPQLSPQRVGERH